MLIKVKVFPDSKIEEVVMVGADKFEVRVRQKAERGLANRRVRQLLAEHFGIMENGARMVKGARKPNKIFEVRQ
jgi:uncharacterized protein YggU (UPF0235/DUF167 family)